MSTKDVAIGGAAKAGANVASSVSYAQSIRASDIENAGNAATNDLLGYKDDLLGYVTPKDATLKKPVVPVVHRPNVNRVTVPSLIVVSLVYLVIFSVIFLFYDAVTTGFIADILVSGYEMCKSAVADSAKDPTSTANLADISYATYTRHWRDQRWRVVLRKMGLFVAVFGSLFAGLLGFVYVYLMKGSNAREAAKIIGICLATMIGTTFLLVDNQYFVTIFENTVGYQCMVSLKSTRDTIQALFKHKTFTQASFPGLSLWMNFLLSVFHLNNFGYVLQQIGDTTRPTNQFDFTLQSPAEPGAELPIRDLAKGVARKHAMGHLCWIYFSAIAATMIAVKQLSVIV